MHAGRNARRIALAILLFLGAAEAQEVKRTYAMKSEGRVVGYLVETEKEILHDGVAAISFETRSLVSIELLGSRMEQKVDQTWILDRRSRAALSVRSRMEVADRVTEVTGERSDGGFSFGPAGDSAVRKTIDPAKVVVSPEFHWIEALPPIARGESCRQECLLPELGTVVTYEIRPEPVEQEIDVLGRRIRARVRHLRADELGISATMHLAADTGEALRYELTTQKLVIERAPEAAVQRIERMDLTDSILVKTNVAIEDVSVVTFMKLKAEIRTAADTTLEQLSVPGQRFEGTVEDGIVRGTFEIRPRRLRDEEWPAFPLSLDEKAREELKPFLAPEADIESDDPAILAKARELATGAASVRTVLERFADWICGHVTYRIPGGGSAKRTMELGAGECAGHSRLLAALLRAVGMPARTPMGGMYVPIHGGSFGQHMWTEVWLGKENGWLAVDCTAGEATFIDAGHIRLKSGATVFSPKAIEVLEYEPKPAKGTGSEPARNEVPFPYEAGETLAYTYSLDGTRLGTETMRYAGKDERGHVFSGTLDLALAKYREDTETVVGDDGRLVAFSMEQVRDSDGTTTRVAMTETGAEITTGSGEGAKREVVATERSALVLHNNCMAHLAIALSRLWPLAPGRESRVRVFHPVTRLTFPITFKAGEAREIAWPTDSADQIAAREVQVGIPGLDIKVLVDGRGRILRYEQKQGKVLVELEPR